MNIKSVLDKINKNLEEIKKMPFNINSTVAAPIVISRIPKPKIPGIETPPIDPISTNSFPQIVNNTNFDIAVYLSSILIESDLKNIV